jgi:hypothetical protein
VQPDLAGFQDAHRRLRDQAGTTVIFERVEVTFPPEVPVDQDGRPFDPVLTAASGLATVASASASCTVAYRTTRQSGEAEVSPIGWVESAHVLITGHPELASGIAASATHARLRDARYKILAVRLDPGLADRTLIAARAED